MLLIGQLMSAAHLPIDNSFSLSNWCQLLIGQVISAAHRPTHLLAFSRVSGSLTTTPWELLCWTPKLCHDEHFDSAWACLSSFILEKLKCKKVKNVTSKTLFCFMNLLDNKTKQAFILTFMCHNWIYLCSRTTHSWSTQSYTQNPGQHKLNMQKLQSISDIYRLRKQTSRPFSSTHISNNKT